jgi:hypothetical protein
MAKLSKSPIGETLATLRPSIATLPSDRGDSLARGQLCRDHLRRLNTIMFIEDDEWVKIAVATLRVLLTRPYITSDVAAQIQGEIDELLEEMRGSGLVADVAVPTNYLEASFFGLSPVTGDDYS